MVVSASTSVKELISHVKLVGACVVGERVGCSVGEPVGALVGVSVGDFVGESVG